MASKQFVQVGQEGQGEMVKKEMKVEEEKKEEKVKKEEKEGEEEVKEVQEKPPYTEGEDVKSGLPCYLCSSFTGTSYHSIMEHLRRKHNLQHKDLKDTHLHKMARAEMSAKDRVRYNSKQGKEVQGGKGKQAKSEGEEKGVGEEIVKPVPGPSEHQGPQQGGAEGVHGGGEHDGTLVKQDGTTWQAMWVRVGPAGQPLHPIQMEKMEGSAAKTAGSWMAQMATQIAAATGPKQIEVKLPKVGTAPLLAEWDHPGGDAKRNTCPIPSTSELDFKPFKNYLVDVGLKASSVDYNLQSINRFFNLLAIEEGQFELAGVLCSIYQNDVMQQVMDSPLMDPKYTWSRNIVTALEHFCDHLKVFCNKKRWIETRTTLQQLVDEVLCGYKRKGIDHRKDADKRKFQFDATRLENFPSKEQIKAAVHEAMLSLAVLSLNSAGKSDLDFMSKLNATTAMVGIVYYNSFAGRSGEWQTMTREHVVQQIADGKSFLLCPDHKTADTYGTLAKYVPAGSMEAMKIHINLPGKSRDLLLEPASAQSQHVSIAQHLKRFGTVFLNSADPPNCNLIRKQYHTMLLRLSREGAAMELMCKVDAHSAEVAKKVYATTTPGDDAQLGKILHEQLFGAPVGWPSQDQINAKLEQPDLTQQLQLVMTEEHGENEAEWQETPDDEDELDFVLDAVGPGIEEGEKRDEKKDEEKDVKKEKKEKKEKSENKEKNAKKEKKEEKEKKEKKVKEGKKVEKENKEEKEEGEEAKGCQEEDPEPVRKKGRKSPFTSEQKDWITGKLDGSMVMPHNQRLKEITTEGIQSSILKPGTTFESLRHVLRIALQLAGQDGVDIE
jgi:hypothetical protein